jgi:hypothetical protein
VEEAGVEPDFQSKLRQARERSTPDVRTARGATVVQARRKENKIAICTDFMLYKGKKHEFGDVTPQAPTRRTGTESVAGQREGRSDIGAESKEEGKLQDTRDESS